MRRRMPKPRTKRGTVHLRMTWYATLTKARDQLEKEMSRAEPSPIGSATRTKLESGSGGGRSGGRRESSSAPAATSTFVQPTRKKGARSLTSERRCFIMSVTPIEDPYHATTATAIPRLRASQPLLSSVTAAAVSAAARLDGPASALLGEGGRGRSGPAPNCSPISTPLPPSPTLKRSERAAVVTRGWAAVRFPALQRTGPASDACGDSPSLAGPSAAGLLWHEDGSTCDSPSGCGGSSGCAEAGSVSESGAICK
mmetsp:Transcript_35486/g.114431  ORF Transcript_35486/g.114431 Transcript_35486/m.114431 type:complete len:255 (+) Transcript_35486:282-1046(+)